MARIKDFEVEILQRGAGYAIYFMRYKSARVEFCHGWTRSVSGAKLPFLTIYSASATNLDDLQKLVYKIKSNITSIWRSRIPNWRKVDYGISMPDLVEWRHFFVGMGFGERW